MQRQGCNGDGEPYAAFVEHDPVDLECTAEEGKTRQEFKDECDINILLAQYERTGVVSHINPRSPMYLDVTDVPDLRGAIDLVNAANESFMTLPAAVRKTFDNDPVQFVEFASDPRNIGKLREWGLAAPETAVQGGSASAATSVPDTGSNEPASS